MKTPVTTIIRGPSTADLLRSVQRAIHRAGVGILASFKPSGHYPILWTGHGRVSNDCSLVRAQDMDLGRTLGVLARNPEVVWAFPDGEGAEARLYGFATLQAERPPELDDIEMPLEVTTHVLCVTFEIPSHGISLLSRLPGGGVEHHDPPAAVLPSRESLQENVARCLMTAKWPRPS